jgi:ribonuclease HII
MDSKQLAQKYRQTLLRKIVQSILSGKFMHREPNSKELNQVHNLERQEYQSPVERSGYNYGYQTIGEMEAGNTQF